MPIEGVYSVEERRAFVYEYMLAPYGEKQKLLKAGYEARERAKREKEREREERAAEEKRDGEERDRDLSGWAAKLRREQEAIMTRIKERTRRKAALTDRKSAASQARMKSIANLAADDRLPKKRRKAGGGACGCGLCRSCVVCSLWMQRTCSVRTTRTGRSIARS